MVVADANCKFLYVDIGGEGAGDGGPWYKCTLNKATEQWGVGFPEDRSIPNDNTSNLLHLIGDDAFTLKP